VSLSWRERVTITLSPRQVTMERYARGLRPALKDRKDLACPVCADGASWQPAVDVLRDALTHPNIDVADATVIVSNHFVRYLLLPWNPDLVTAQEELAFASARFVQAFGEAAQGWVLRLSPVRPGTTGVACALDRALLETVTALLAASPLRLRSLQPSLMAICNERSKLPAGDAWIAIAESGRLLLGALRAGQWVSLRGRPLNGHAVALAEIIAQEALLLGIEPDSGKIYLHRSGEAELYLHGLKVHDWLSAGTARQAGSMG
jgi:hypothetical protein